MKSPLSNPTSPKLYKSSYNTMPTFENTTTTTTTTVPFHNNINLKRRSKTPSFSSILLDAIYRSIDDTYTDTDSSSSQHNHTSKTTTSTTTSSSTKTINHDHHHNNVRNYDYVHASKQRRTKMRSDSHLQTIELRHAILIDSWIDKQPQPQPLPQPQPKQQSYYIYNNHNHNSNDNKFDRQKSVPSKSNTTTTSCFTQPKICSNITTSHATQKRETSSKIFKNTKLKALKLYSDLKKPKQRAQQPISPGARFAAFLNSLFKNSGSTPTRRSTTTTATSAIKTTAIRQCSHTQLNRKDHSPENDRQLPSKGKEIDALMMMMKRNRSSDDEMINNNDDNDNDNDDNDDDDDDSCASSDLFELENFGSIGVSRFSQELPVYGTTSFSKLIS